MEGLRRSSAFSYVCNACNRCCHDKRIHVNPYEVARLARNRGTSTTEILAHFTEDGGSALAVRTNGACVFLSDDGCSVHADRPLACRLYPLGRIVTHEGEESFVELEPHAESAGDYGVAGTVGEYIASQDVDSYFHAATRYREVLSGWMMELQETSGRADERTSGRNSDEADAALLDVDRAVAFECARAGNAEPTGIDERVAIHLAFLEAYGG